MRVAEADDALRHALDLARGGRIAEAERACRGALSRTPHDARLLSLLGHLLVARGAHGEAAVAVAAALRADPKCVAALIEDAGLALRAGDAQRALSRYDEALALVPPNAGLLLQVAQAASAAGDRERTRRALQHAQSIDPGEPSTGLALLRLESWQRRHADAVAVAESVLRRAPQAAEAWRLLGESLIALGRSEDALAAFTEGRRRTPADIPLLDALARLLDATAAPADARAGVRADLAAAQPGPRRFGELGLALWQAQRFDEAHAAFRRARQLDPSWLPARWALFQYPRDAVYADDAAVASFRASWLAGLGEVEALATPADPADGLAAATLCTNFFLHYTTDDVRDVQRRYARAIERLVRAAVPEHATPAARAGDGRRRVAVFSAHLGEHTIMRLFGAMLHGLDRSRIQLGVFHPGGDATLRERVLHAGDHVDCGPRSVPEWAAAIRAFAPDVLVHTDLGMQPLAQCLASLRLAPVQAVLWGHPVTTGFEHIDVFLSSALMEPDDGAAHYHERLLPLPGLGTAFAPPARAPRIPAELVDRDPSRVEYLFLQSVYKNLPLHDRVLARIAQALPAARFHLTPHADAGVCQRLRRRVEATFAAAGVDAGRHLGLVRGLPPPEFLGLASAGSVNLDSIGWSGGNTTLEALWFDLPTVTLPGRPMRTRHTAAMLELLELPELIARDVDDYVRIAVRLGGSSDLRASVRERIAQRKHRLYDDRAVVAAFEAFCIDPRAALEPRA
jgi:protein O-GlcNAc transferase